MFHSSGFAVRSCRFRLRNNVCFLAVVTVLLLVGLPGSNAFAQSPPSEEADVLIKGGHVIDGTGGPWMMADVAIKGDRIVYVGRAPVKAKRVIDATGKVVTPGFFDMHAHSEFGLSLDGRGLSMVTQGVDDRGAGRTSVGWAGAWACGGRSDDDYAACQEDVDDAGRVLFVSGEEGYRTERRVVMWGRGRCGRR